MLQSTLYFLILGLVVFSPAVSALGISGSSTIQPIIEQRIPLYTAQGGEAVTLKEGGSGNGIINATSRARLAARGRACCSKR